MYTLYTIHCWGKILGNSSYFLFSLVTLVRVSRHVCATSSLDSLGLPISVLSLRALCCFAAARFFIPVLPSLADVLHQNSPVNWIGLSVLWKECGSRGGAFVVRHSVSCLWLICLWCLSLFQLRWNPLSLSLCLSFCVSVDSSICLVSLFFFMHSAFHTYAEQCIAHVFEAWDSCHCFELAFWAHHFFLGCQEAPSGTPTLCCAKLWLNSLQTLLLEPFVRFGKGAS